MLRCRPRAASALAGPVTATAPTSPFRQIEGVLDSIERERTKSIDSKSRRKSVTLEDREATAVLDERSNSSTQSISQSRAFSLKRVSTKSSYALLRFEQRSVEQLYHRLQPLVSTDHTSLPCPSSLAVPPPPPSVCRSGAYAPHR